jgi:hypothetical protein
MNSFLLINYDYSTALSPHACHGAAALQNEFRGQACATSVPHHKHHTAQHHREKFSKKDKQTNTTALTLPLVRQARKRQKQAIINYGITEK